MIVKGKVRFVNEYADGTKSVEIHFHKPSFMNHLPIIKNARAEICLEVKEKNYIAGISHTDNNSYIWINPNCKIDGVNVRLSDVILGAGFQNTDEIYIKFDGPNAKVISHNDICQIVLGEEVDTEDDSYYEGSYIMIKVNAYERNLQARRACLQHYGTSCFVCGFNFKDLYGEEADGFIHVHHLKPISEIGERYEVDPIRDLRPVCPNCHAFIHLNGNCKSIEEVKNLINGA